jgi:hypothetical protein
MLTTLLVLATLADTDHVRRATPPRDPNLPRAVNAVRLTAPVKVDGLLDEGVWQRPGMEQFTQREPVPDSAPTERTSVWVAYDDKAIYVAARMYDAHPDSIMSILARRDRFAQSDRFNVWIDAYNDNRTGFFFGVNAAGTQYDGTMFNDEWDDDSWNGVWEGTARRDAEGWTAEFRIPYSELRFKDGDQQVWGINFNRFIARKNERDYLVYTPRNGSGYVSRFPDLLGMNDVHPTRRLVLLPYVTTRSHLGPAAAGDPFFDGSRSEMAVGGDVQAGLGGNLTLDATINPDFGQVEVDPAFVNLSDVEVTFQEKRPFFIEGSSIFDFGYGGANNYWGFNWGGPDFFYSRRIGGSPHGSAPPTADYATAPQGTTIIGAAKVSGKLSRTTSLGLLTSLTQREFADYSTGGTLGQAEIEPLASYNVARVQKEINNGREGVGLIGTYTARKFDDASLRDIMNSSGTMLGADGWLTLDQDAKWVMTGWLIGSRIEGNTDRITSVQQNSAHYFQRPDQEHVSVDSNATALMGWGSRVTLNKQKGDWKFNTAVGLLDPGLDVNDLGVSARVDVINSHAVLGYQWSRPTSWYQEARTDFATYGNWTYGGLRTNLGVTNMGYITFKGFNGINWNAGFNPSSYNVRLTRGGPRVLTPNGWSGNLSYYTDERKALSASAGAYASGNTGMQTSAGFNLGVTYRPSSNLTLTAGPSFDRFYTRTQYQAAYDDPTSPTYAKRYVFADLDQTTVSADIRVNWIFTPRLSLEVYAQPFVSSGAYATPKALAEAGSFDFLNYGEDGSTVDETDGLWTIDADGAGPSPEYVTSKPDFTYGSLRGNAVLRWEYLPGSTLFFVWTQDRQTGNGNGEFDFGNAFSDVMATQGDNIFAVKATYYWRP